MTRRRAPSSAVYLCVFLAFTLNALAQRPHGRGALPQPDAPLSLPHPELGLPIAPMGAQLPRPPLPFDPRQPLAGLPIHSSIARMTNTLLTGGSLDASSIFLEPPAYDSGGFGVRSVVVADLNGDGHPDLVAANQCQNNTNCPNGGLVSVFLSNGDGTFQPAVGYSSGGYVAISLTVGDLNGDGHPDLVVANLCQTTNCSNGLVSVLLGNGDGTFQSPVGYNSGGIDAFLVAVGDVNSDGHPDLVVANLCLGSCSNGGVGVLLGNGDGTFQAPLSYPSPGQDGDFVVIGDLNGDGHPDLVVTNECQNGSCNNGVIAVFMGNGDGTFQSPVSYPGGYIPLSVAIADVNGDNYPDLIVANQCQSNITCGNGAAVSLFLGNGDGTFQSPVSYSSGGLYAQAIAVADLNGDGHLDLVVSNQCEDPYCASGGYGVLLGNGDGTFQAPARYSSPGRATLSLALGDMDGDGHLDLAVADVCQNNSNCEGLVSVVKGNGDGTFQAPLSYNPAGYNSTSVATADVNGDGHVDIVVSNACQSNTDCTGDVSVLLGNGHGGFQTLASYPTGGWIAESVAVGDLNGDSHPDLVVANQCQSNSTCVNGGVLSVLLGNGDGSYQTPVIYNSGGAIAFAVAIADVNGDGHPDLVVANDCQSSSNCINGVVSVLLGNGDGTFQAPASYNSGDQGALSVAIADVNGDGLADLIVANQCQNGSNCSNGTVGVLINNGDGTFQLPVTYNSGGQYAFSLAVGDINGDGHPDIIVANQCQSSNNCNNGELSVLLGNGDGTFQPGLSTATSNQCCTSRSLALGDFNGDGKLDVASSASDVLLLGNGDGTFQTPLLLGGGGGGAAVGDFNEDGKPDLAVGGVTILLNTAAGYRYQTGVGLTSSLNPAPGGQPVTFTATITPAFNAGAVGGSVTFYDGANALGSASVSNGQAAFTTSSLSLGGHSITATYSGDTNYLASTSGVLTETINSSVTTTTVGSSVNPSSFGQVVSFTAVVTPQGPGTPTGTVTFNDRNNVLGSASLNGGSAVLQTSALAIGAHSITASYTGNSSFQPSTSTPLAQQVNQAATATTLTSSPNPSLQGQSVTLTATVSPAFGGAPTGTVTFIFNNTSLGTAALNGSGQASVSTTILPVGSDTIIATYSGDTNFTSSSGNASQVVRLATTTSLKTSLNPVLVGQSVTLTATVTSKQKVNQGTVNFLDGNQVIASSTVSSGKATAVVTFSTIGIHNVTASYVGTQTFAGSTSGILKEKVQAATATVVASSLNPSSVGQAVVFTATVSSTFGTPGGSVTFRANGTLLGTKPLSGGVALIKTSSLAAGTYTITATYSGNVNFQSSSGSLTQTVQ